ncbi:uncharacterized protein LOC141914209 [Tubulanus polymorphus]|uniref:uncharacterized protein LOC141914209 n=1 Tax=Tubulanus polymorphus TaxID=672921 RepID=UPI003DA6596A
MANYRSETEITASENVSVGAQFLDLNGSDLTTTTTEKAGFVPGSRCKYIHHSDYKPPHENLYIQITIYVIVSFAFFGFGANLLSFTILSKERSNNTSIFYLRCLAVADMFICLSYIVFDFQYQLYSHTLLLDMTAEINHAMKRMYSYTRNFRLLFSGVSDLITLLIAIDRYIVVCWPLKAAGIVSMKKSYTCIVFVVAITIGDQSRNFFKYYPRRSRNPCTGHERWAQKFTPFARNKYLRYFEVFVHAPAFTIIPTVIVVLITIRLIFTLRRAGAARKTMSTTNNQTSNSSSSSSSDRSLTLVLVLISCFYLLKKAFLLNAAIGNLHTTINGKIGKGFIPKFLNLIINIVRMIVASSNFVIYCASRRRFRDQLKAMFSMKKAVTNKL